MINPSLSVSVKIYYGWPSKASQLHFPLTHLIQGHILNIFVKNISLRKPMEPKELRERLFFTAQDVASAYGITLRSAHVLCSRYVKRGTFIRLKKNFYILDRDWEQYGRGQFFQICNFLQVPSYISCMTALGFHGITTQVQRNWYESISKRRSHKIDAPGISFCYHKVQPPYFFGFARQDGFFIAGREKALLDAVYLNSLGLYPLDWSSLTLDILDREKLKDQMTPFPDRVKRKIRKLCKI